MSILGAILVNRNSRALTSDAQSALRRTIERYTRICRFILSVNFSSRVIEPIQSRCTVFRFSPIKEDDIKALRLNFRLVGSYKDGEELLDVLLEIERKHRHLKEGGE